MDHGVSGRDNEPGIETLGEDCSPVGGRERLLRGRLGALARFLGALVLGAGAAFLLFLVGERFFARTLPFPLLAGVQGLVAAFFSRLFALEWWWSVIQLALPVLVLAVGAFSLPGWVFPLVTAVWVIVFWNSIFGRVPLFLTNQTTAQALAQCIAPLSRPRILDAGHGFAGVLFALARTCPEARLTGCETAPFPFVVSWLRRRFVSRHANVVLRYQNFWEVDFSDFDVVYAFLSPTPMRALYEKARAEMRPGSLFISNSFSVQGVPPDRTVQVADRRRTRLLVWHM